MQYIYRDNGGKHRAWNTGLPYIRGEYTFVVDSDDYLTDDAVAKIRYWIAGLKKAGVEKHFAGVSGQKREGIHGETIGGFPKHRKYVDATNLQRVWTHLGGDKAEVYRTDLLRKHPFPEFEGEKFCSEGAVMSIIAKEGYQLRWYPDVIYICEYREDGLTKGVVKDRMSFFRGYTYVMRYGEKYDQFPINYIEIGKYLVWAQKKGYSYKQGAELINVSMAKAMFSSVINKANEWRISIRMKLKNLAYNTR